MLRFAIVLLCVCVLSALSYAIPGLSRKYGIACSSCHVHGAKLNAFGQVFRQRGAKVAGLEAKEKGQPITVWMSFVSANRTSEPDRFLTFPSRLQIVSIGEWDNNVRYFFDWFPFHRALQTNGSDINRSGRFENLFFNGPLSADFSFQVGQFRPLFAIDPNRRISMSEPFALSSSLPGRLDSDARVKSLRAFSPTLRSPAARLSWTQWDDPEMDLESWQAHMTALFPGEFSIPTTSEARRNASFEFEDRPKGFMVEALRQTTDWLVALFHFFGDNERNATGIAGTYSNDRWHLETSLWSGRAEGVLRQLRATIDLCLSSEWKYAFGLRFDKVEGEAPWIVPYASFHLGGKEDAWRFAAEARLRNGTPTVFALEIHFLR